MCPNGWVRSNSLGLRSPDLSEEKLKSESEDIPAWLSSLEQEEAQATTPTASDEDLPAWLRGEEEAAPEPLELEPTRLADWQPLEEKEPDLAQPVSEEVSRIPRCGRGNSRTCNLFSNRGSHSGTRTSDGTRCTHRCCNLIHAGRRPDPRAGGDDLFRREYSGRT